MTKAAEGVLERRLHMARVGDPTVRGIMNLFVASAHVMEAFERVVGQAGLTYASFNVLRILRGHPEGHPRRVISQRLVARNADVTRLVDGLVSQGLVRRSRSRSDRRLSLATITPKGMATLAELDPQIARFVEEYRGRLPAGEWAKLGRLLEAIYAADL